MKLGSKNTLDMREGNIAGNIFKFGIPILLTGMLQLCYNAADVIVVGRFSGSEAIAAVGSTGSLINLLVNVFMGMSVGTSVCVSKAFGANDRDQMNRALHTSVAIAAISAVIVTTAGMIALRPLLEIVQTPANVIDQSALYMRIIFIGVFFSLIYNFASAALRAVGDTKRPLIILAISGLLNVLLNLLLVIVFNLGVAGVAIATVASQGVSMVLLLYIMITKETGGLQLKLKDIKIHKDVFGPILKVGLPAGLQGSLFALSSMMIQSGINSFGSNAMAANTASTSLEGFLYIVLGCIHQANITFASQNYGAKLYSRVRACYWNCMVIALVLTSILCIVFNIFAEDFIALYNQDPEVIELGVFRLKLITSLFWTWVLADITTAQARALGCSIVTTIVSVVGICVFRVFWMAIPFANDPSLFSLYISCPISWFFTFLMLIPVYIVVARKLPKRDYEVV